MGATTAEAGKSLNDTPWLAQVRHEQIAYMYRNGIVTVPITTLAAAVLVWLFLTLRVADPVVAWTWFGLLTAQSAARIGLLLLWRRAAPASTDWRRWANRFTAGVLVGGVLWGFGTLFLMPAGRFDLQMVVIMLITAIVYGSISSFGGWLPAFYAFLFPALAPGVVWSLLQGDVEHIAYGVMATIWVPAMAMLGFRYSRSLERSIALGFENAALAEDARRQKNAAEEANLAKSRFLAAASHDLRQPVHALGLFAGALKLEEGLPPKATDLAERIDGAVETLDRLFVSLLDMSKLDAGVVKPELRVLDMGAMARRIAAEMRPAAEAKGLELRVQAGSCWVASDPILLERIVRNLVSNAVRYTAKGRILVGVRARGREKAVVEVWDTGPGIPEHQREMVFEEFYRGGAENRKDEGGLGLGLAIVRRLCALMGHELELKSEAGRGSLFRIRVPTALAPVIEARPADAPAAAVKARIWVIDDDPAVRAAMEALLGAWGHDVSVLGSSDEALALLERDRALPEAILCDWRLDGEDGLAVLRRLQARMGVAVPAALITGETDPERLREVSASGLPLLHKPVAKASLRALIGNLVRMNLADA
jgi:signal transduction histidine kinase/CheY-like chemotaxis protein